MSTEKLVEKLGQQVARRTFLAKVGVSAVGALLGVLGLPQSVYAYTYKCCSLCFSPTSSCSGNCPTATAAGQWCWHCTYTDGRVYKCCECKQVGAPCDRSCTGVTSSYVALTGLAPEPD